MVATDGGWHIDTTEEGPRFSDVPASGPSAIVEDDSRRVILRYADGTLSGAPTSTGASAM